MAFNPKWGSCSICGKPMIIRSAVQKYCEECKEIAKKQRKQEHHEIVVAKRTARKRGTDPDRYAGKDTECRVKGSCMYGGEKFCEYASITGRSRLLSGYPIRGGRCDAYKRGKRKRGKQTLPIAPNLPSGKLGEV